MPMLYALPADVPVEEIAVPNRLAIVIQLTMARPISAQKVIPCLHRNVGDSEVYEEVFPHQYGASHRNL